MSRFDDDHHHQDIFHQRQDNNIGVWCLNLKYLFIGRSYNLRRLLVAALQQASAQRRLSFVTQRLSQRLPQHLHFLDSANVVTFF